VKEKTRRAIAYAAAGRINKKARSSIYSYESFSYGFSYTVSNVMTLGGQAIIISQASPSGFQSNCNLPSRSWTTRPTTRVPKPGGYAA